MLYKRLAKTPDVMIVRFEISGKIWAEQVNLVGDFNDWDQTSLPFNRNREGNWEIELSLAVGQSYRFRYLLNGTEWTDELQADSFIENEYGSHDSVVVTTIFNPPRRSSSGGKN